MKTIKKKIAGGLLVMAVAGLAACGSGSVTCTASWPAKTNFSTGLIGLSDTGLDSTAFGALAAEASAKAEQQGYTTMAAVVAGMPVSDLVEGLKSGTGTSADAFQRVTLSNATLVNSRGTAVLSMTLKGKAVGSAEFSYRVSDGQLRFDSPSAVDQWILAYQGGVADTLAAGIPDLTIDTGGGNSQVAFATGANYRSSELASDSKSWYSEKRNCARCALN